MKVKELIAELKQCDPNSLVVAGGEIVWFTEEIPWYWDGVYLDDSTYKTKDPPLKYYANGYKVRLNLWDAEDWFERVCLDWTGKKIPLFRYVINKMKLDSYYLKRNKVRYIDKMMDIWIDWFFTLRSMYHVDPVDRNWIP